MAYAISDIVRDSRGVPVSDALVYVYSPQGGLATLYNDLGAPISNPLATNDNGLFEGYATEDGYHKLSIHYGGRERSTDEVLLGTEPIARAEGAAAVLAAVNGGYWEESLTPPPDAAEGQDFYASFDGRAILARNTGGAGVIRWELTTQAGVDANYKLTGGYSNFNIFEEVDANRRARLLYRPVSSGAHAGTLVAGWGIEHRASGSGANGPANSDVGAVVSTIKTSDNTGEIDVLYLYGKQRGANSDIAGALCQIDRKGGTGFSAQWEGTTRDLNAGTGVPEKAIRNQIGVTDTVNDLSFGFFALAEVGVFDHGLLLTSSDGGSFTNFITLERSAAGGAVFTVDGQGAVQIRKAGLLENESHSQDLVSQYAATGSAGSPGNTISAAQEFRHYTTPGDWRTTEYRQRWQIDGNTALDTSPWWAFRGLAGGGTTIMFGFGVNGAEVARASIPYTGGLKLEPMVNDPANPEPGTIWFNSTDNQLKFRKNATTVVLG